MSAWSRRYEGFDPDQEGLREALCTLGKGYFATPAVAPESNADGVDYPGHTLLAVTTVLDHILTGTPWRTRAWSMCRTDCPSLSGWRVPTGPMYPTWNSSTTNQKLDLHRGVLTRSLEIARLAQAWLRTTGRSTATKSRKGYGTR